MVSEFDSCRGGVWLFCGRFLLRLQITLSVWSRVPGVVSGSLLSAVCRLFARTKVVYDGGCKAIPWVSPPLWTYVRLLLRPQGSYFCLEHAMCKGKGM